MYGFDSWVGVLVYREYGAAGAALCLFVVVRRVVYQFVVFRVCRQIDLMCRCFVSVRTIMWGSGLVSSILCRSSMVVCILLVFNVRSLRLWCE